MNSEAELTQLKQEVNDLWTRYRKHEPLAVQDDLRRALAEQNRALEEKRRLLADRSATLRLELEQHRRRASRLSPAVRVAGGLLGAVVTALLVASALPELAALSLGFSAGEGAALLACSLLVLALSLSRVDR